MSNFPAWFQPDSFDRNLPRDVPLRILQIGVYTGDATEWLLNNREIQYIDEVDTWQGSVEHENEIDFAEVEKYYDSRFQGESRISKNKMTSDKFFNSDRVRSYNFIYIDGDHTALQTALDGLNAFRVLESNGIMGFDDYLWDMGEGPHYNPKNGIDSALHTIGNQLEILEVNSQIWTRKF